MKATDIAILLGLMMVGYHAVASEAEKNNPAPDAPAVVVPEGIEAAVAPLKGSLSQYPDKAKSLSALYAAMADAVQRDGGRRLKTFGNFRDAHGALFDLSAVPGGAMIGDRIDKAIGQACGIVDPKGGYQVAVQIDAAKRADLVAALTALSRAFGG